MNVNDDIAGIEENVNVNDDDIAGIGNIADNVNVDQNGNLSGVRMMQMSMVWWEMGAMQVKQMRIAMV